MRSESRSTTHWLVLGLILGGACVMSAGCTGKDATAITEVTILDTNLTHIVAFDLKVTVSAGDSTLWVNEILRILTVSQDTTLDLDIPVSLVLPAAIHDTSFVTDTLFCRRYWKGTTCKKEY